MSMKRFSFHGVLADNVRVSSVCVIPAELLCKKSLRRVSLLFAGMLLFAPCVARADILAGWDVDGVDVADGTGIDESSAPYTFTAGTQHANVAEAKLTLGSGVNPSTTAGQYGFKVSDAKDSLADAITANHYIEFTLEAEAGYVLNLSSLEMNGQSSGNGADDVALLSSIDGFSGGSEIAAVSGISGDTGGFDTDASGFGAAIDLSADGFQGLTLVTFRIYGWNTGGGAGITYLRNLAGDDLVINGSLAAAGPVPSAPVIRPAAATNANSFTAAWNEVADATGYRLDVSTNSAFSNFQAGFENRDVGAVTAYSVTGLYAQVTYYYRVRAYNVGSESVNSATQSVSTTIKPEPGNHATAFSAVTVTHRTIEFSWTDAAGGVLPDGYLVYGSATSYDDIPTPVDGVNVANDTTWSGGLYANKINQGIQADALTQLQAEQTYYFKLFPYANQFSTIDYKTDGAVPQLTVTTASVPYEDMEDASKQSYSNNVVSLNSGDWAFDEALLGITSSDKRRDQRSARIRGLGSLSMLFDVEGAGRISLEHANFGNDTDGEFVVEASINEGASWYPLGPEVSCGPAFQTTEFPVTTRSRIRFRFRKTGLDDDESRINIDNVKITPFVPNGTVFFFR